MASSAKKQRLAKDVRNRIKQNGRSSPETNCPICLERTEDRAFANKCFHSFCKTCLVEWSKVKAECPVCRQRFDKIIFNVKAMDDYEELNVPRSFDFPSWYNWDGLQRSLFTSHSLNSGFVRSNVPHVGRQVLELQSLIENYHNISRLSLVISSPSTRHTSVSSHTHSFTAARDLFPPPPGTSDFRRYIYQTDLWVLPFGNGDRTRTRESSAEFYHRNPGCTHRLGPWLNRELVALIENGNIQMVFDNIMRNLKRFDIISEDFRRLIQPFVFHHAAHFIHEFYNFARSCYDMEAFNHIAKYDRRDRVDLSYLRGMVPVPVPTTSFLNTTENLSNENDSDSESSVIVVDSDSESDVPLTPGRNVSTNEMSNAQECEAAGSINVNIDSTDRELSITLIDDFDNPTPGPSGIQVRKMVGTRIEKCSDSETDIDVGKEDVVAGFGRIPNEADVESDASVQIVDVLKPKHERTPEVIDVESDEESAEKPNEEKMNIDVKEESDSKRGKKNSHKKRHSHAHRKSKHKKEKKKRKRNELYFSDSSSSEDDTHDPYWKNSYLTSSLLPSATRLPKLTLKRFHWSSSDNEDVEGKQRKTDSKKYSNDEKPYSKLHKLQSVIVSPTTSQPECSYNHSPEF